MPSSYSFNFLNYYNVFDVYYLGEILAVAKKINLGNSIMHEYFKSPLSFTHQLQVIQQLLIYETTIPFKSNQSRDAPTKDTSLYLARSWSISAKWNNFWSETRKIVPDRFEECVFLCLIRHCDAYYLKNDPDIQFGYIPSGDLHVC